MERKRQQVLLAASVAGLLAALGVTQPAAANEEGQAGGETVPCYGVNKCKGTGDCGGPGHSCAGQNACKGQGYIELSEKDCLRIEGGRLTPQ